MVAFRPIKLSVKCSTPLSVQDSRSTAWRTCELMIVAPSPMLVKGPMSTTEDYARANTLEILARIKSIAGAGCEPEIMGMGPVKAAGKALDRAGIKAGDLDVIELNEAFSAQALACIGELGLDQAKINFDGGAIALGHPLGATGARITGKAAAVLKREGGKYALATQCIGGGQGIATLLEAA